MEKSPEHRYRICISGASPSMATLAELVAQALSCARSGVQGPIVLEALDANGRVLWSAWHSTRASFEARVVELVSESPGSSTRAP